MKLGEQMKVHVLASGSKGNMILISSSDGWIALDVGLSKKLILEKLSKLKVTVNQIKHIVITHEHSDHTRGLKFLIDSNSDVNVYMSKGTLFDLDKKIFLSLKSKINILDSRKKDKIDQYIFTSFVTSHDSKEPLALVFENSKFKVVYMTDTGYVDKKNKQLISCADLYLLESNHDPEKLLSSKRPMSLKKRILGEKGHLSNDDASILINEIICDKKTSWIVMHISESCNSIREIEKAIVRNIKEIKNLSVFYANQNEIKSLIL